VTTATSFDAVIVGAGPAGASAAILLARAGWSVALVERQRYPRRKVCGECIAASNLPLLDALGIGDAFAAAAGAELRRVALMRGAQTLVAPLPAATGAAQPWGRALGREVLDTLLVEQARREGATVLQPWALHAIEGSPGAFRCVVLSVDAGSLAAGAPARRELAAPLVVAAHGSWEALPFERAERRAQRRPSDLFAFKANFRDAKIAPDLLPVLAFDGGYGGMVIADAGLATLACCIREDRLDACRAAEPGARAGDVVERYLTREVRGVAEALAGASREGSWLASGPIRPGMRLPRGGGGDVFLIGNAAGEAHPIIGEGISMALQSACLLAALLGPERAAIADAERSASVQRRLLRAHAATWRRSFSLRLHIAAAFAHVAMRPRATAALWPLASAWPAVLTSGARWSGKTRAVAAAAPAIGT